MEQIPSRIRLRTSGVQREDSDDSIVDLDRYAESRPQAALRSRYNVNQLSLMGIDQGASVFLADDVGQSVLRTGVEATPGAVLRQQYEIGLVVLDDAGRHVAEMPEDVADIESARKRGQQLVKRVQVRSVHIGGQRYGSDRHRRLRWVRLQRLVRLQAKNRDGRDRPQCLR
ncbi:MAG TPA: hypothetical protein VGI56_08060 [Galbitalea sp.]